MNDIIISEELKNEDVLIVKNGIEIKKTLNKIFKVVAGFPGVGKTYLYNKYVNKIKILDSDSSKFDKKEFPDNYIKYIKENIEKQDIILVSTHEVVRNKLIENNIGTILFYPSIDCMDEYIERFIQRGSSNSFIELIKNNWVTWLTDIQKIKNDNILHVELCAGKYLSDVMFFNVTIKEE